MRYRLRKLPALPTTAVEWVVIVLVLVVVLAVLVPGFPVDFGESLQLAKQIQADHERRR